MLAHHKNALIADLAETYQIYDYKRVPVKLLGTLAAGLGHNARVNRAMRGDNYPLETFLLASIADSLRRIEHGLFSDKKEKIPSFVSILLENTEETEGVAFETPEDFWAARDAVLQRINNNV